MAEEERHGPQRHPGFQQLRGQAMAFIPRAE
jgi:hypothetical protein